MPFKPVNTLTKNSAILYTRGGNHTLSLNSKSKTLTIHKVDESIFAARYFGRCMDYNCKDCCCAHGCSVDIAEVDRIMAYKDELEKRLGISSSQWFTPDAIVDIDYPSKYYRRTQPINGFCVFHNNYARGCLLHTMAIEKGFDPHLIKPMVCFLFPVTWDKKCLLLADFLEELPCNQDGDSVVDAVMPELRYYLGEEMAAELENLNNSRK